ncbi:MAG: hypothetical protein MJ061_05365, partial [Mailhella sp.]|nr:hypothetical protein [Mailhella sp.]
MRPFRRPASGIFPVLLLLGLCYCMSFFHRVSPPVISRDLMETFSLDAAGYGLIGTAALLGYGVVFLGIAMLMCV